jgi:hypothetical protein
MNGVPVIVDQRQCMAFLTAGANPFAMREDPIIQKEWPLLKKIAKATNVVDMYDSSTWDGIDFEPVLDIVHRQIAPHANHQQRTESGVKGIADQSRTGVGEDRRNARSITHYYFTREHNKSAKELKLDVDRMQCAESTANYINSAKSLIERIKHAEDWFGKAKCNEVLTQFSCRQLTQGERERAKKVAAFSENLELISFAVTSKAERPQAIEITCQMGGGIYLSVLTAKNGTQRHVRAELEARGLKTEELENKSLKEMKELLKEDELKRRVIETQQEGLKVSSIKYIKPISDEMRGLFSLADKVERRRLGILGDDETDSKM